VQARHVVRVDKSACSPRELPGSAFDDKSEFLVQVDGGLVVGLDSELDPPNAQPVVSQLDHRRHERASNATPLKIVVYRHTHPGAVAATRILLLVQTEVSHHAAVEDRHQAMDVGRELCEPFPPQLE